MSVQVSVYIATSLDGFIARPNGDIDWLDSAGSNGADEPDDTANESRGSEEPEDFGYEAFMATVDCMVMGRNSLEKVLTFPGWPYEGQRVVVLSTTLAEPPPQAQGKVEMCREDPAALVERLRKEGCQRLYVDGGKTIQSFIRQGLVTDLTITVIPVLLGKGLPLFGELGGVAGDLRLKHQATKSFSNGFVQSVYRV